MIRVLRLMEYEFKNYEEAERHFASCGVPTNGMRVFGTIVRGEIKVRSTILITPFPVEKVDNE